MYNLYSIVDAFTRLVRPNTKSNLINFSDIEIDRVGVYIFLSRPAAAEGWKWINMFSVLHPS